MYISIGLLITISTVCKSLNKTQLKYNQNVYHHTECLLIMYAKLKCKNQMQYFTFTKRKLTNLDKKICCTLSSTLP